MSADLDIELLSDVVRHTGEHFDVRTVRVEATHETVSAEVEYENGVIVPAVRRGV